MLLNFYKCSCLYKGNSLVLINGALLIILLSINFVNTSSSYISTCDLAVLQATNTNKLNQIIHFSKSTLKHNV